MAQGFRGVKLGARGLRIVAVVALVVGPVALSAAPAGATFSWPSPIPAIGPISAKATPAYGQCPYRGITAGVCQTGDGPDQQGTLGTSTTQVYPLPMTAVGCVANCSAGDYFEPYTTTGTLGGTPSLPTSWCSSPCSPLQVYWSATGKMSWELSYLTNVNNADFPAVLLGPDGTYTCGTSTVPSADALTGPTDVDANDTYGYGGTNDTDGWASQEFASIPSGLLSQAQGTTFYAFVYVQGELSGSRCFKYSFTWPGYDASWGPGGTAVLGTPTLACTGAVTTNGSGVATLNAQGVMSTGVGSWGSGSWVAGDGSASVSGMVVNHSYTLSSEPAGGWTATATATATAAAGYTFPGGGTTDTVTCSANVSFAAAASNSGSGTVSSSPTSADDCVPSGWSVLNPVALIRGLGCLLQYLFIPASSTLSGQVTTLKGDVSSSPLGSAAAPLTVITDGFSDVGDGYDSVYNASHSGGVGAEKCGGGGMSLPLIPGHSAVQFDPLNSCTGGASSVAHMVRAFLTFAMWIGAALASARIVAGALGLKLPGMSGQGEEE